MLTERPGVERIKRKNIIDLALGLTAMTRIFSVRSKARDWPKIYPRHHPLLAFRRQLKARLLKERIVTQIVRETTLTPEEFRRDNALTSEREKRRLSAPQLSKQRDGWPS